MEKASYVMYGGNGPNSYFQNSWYQKEGVNITRDTICESIASKLDINHFSTSSTFVIADFGCSTGPNTFAAVQNIVEAVKLKYKEENSTVNSHVPEFQVYFIDHVSNDFNTLFESLPPNRQYFAVGVPGSFHGRILPGASIHFAYSSYSLHWLSKLPVELLDKSSLTWNNGRISYVNASKEVVQAYSDQFASDMESFLQSRAEEVLTGGLMALLLFVVPDGSPRYTSPLSLLCDSIGSILSDMVMMGKLSEDEVDSFNIPIYEATQQELKSVIEINGCFNIEKMEPITRLITKDEGIRSLMAARAALDSVLKTRFSCDIIDEVFRRFSTKAAEYSNDVSPLEKHPSELFVLLKRK